MKNNLLFRAFFLMATFAMIMISLAACAPSTAIASSDTPEPVQEVTIAPTASPSPTPEPTEVPTPAVDEYGFTEERTAELNQQFQDFFNYQGEFTREKMLEKMMVPASNLDQNEAQLGTVNGNEEIQGYFFDYFEKDDRVFMLLGFDGEDGNRFVSPVEIPLYVYKQCFETHIQISEYNYSNFISNDNVELKYLYGEKEIISLLNTLKSKVIVLGLNTMEYKGSYTDDDNQAALDEGIKELNSKVELTFGLFQLVSSNNISNDNPERGDTTSIIKIENINDVENIEVPKVPVLLNMSYFKDILDTK